MTGVGLARRALTGGIVARLALLSTAMAAAAAHAPAVGGAPARAQATATAHPARVHVTAAQPSGHVRTRGMAAHPPAAPAAHPPAAPAAHVTPAHADGARSSAAAAAAHAASARGAPARPPAHAARPVTPTAKVAPAPVHKPTKVVVGPRAAPAAGGAGGGKDGKDEIPLPAADDRDRDRIVRMQEALREIVHGGALGRLHVGMKVMAARSGRLFFERRGTVLMDPASNQKVLATTTAIMRLGTDWRFRTELSGALPDAAGVIAGDVYLRGGGDPTVRSADLEALAARLARRGVRRIDGAVVADPRSLTGGEVTPPAEPLAEAGEPGERGAKGDLANDAAGADAPSGGGAPSPRPALMVNRGLMLIRVRPSAQANLPAQITTSPADDTFSIHNGARTVAGGRSRVLVRLSLAGGKMQIDVSGRIAVGHLGLAFRRRVPHQALYAAVLLRAALAEVGITVRDPPRFGAAPPSAGLLERHESAPLGILLRKINKDSDNDQAERVLETAGAEVYGGPPTTEKGVQLLREVIGQLGLPPGSYVPRNGSGLGHANRITADAMASLLRALYLDPRIGPEILQSMSVGGVDGTTRNRFKGSLAAKRVRAKTGTLQGKSCLSGLVGDGPDVVVFSILVDGLRGRTLTAVRDAQVGAVNAIMRYVREGTGERIDLPPGGLEPPAGGVDLETGEEISEQEGEATEAGDAGKAGEDPVDSYLKKERDRAATK
jgi:D-alanyl-D-alanine carboxypeptidase/D-alanyl-D-alanine-endopeptidase (penicillin-binding protein 4)